MHFDFPAGTQHILHVRETVHRVCLEMGFTPRDAGLVITAVWEAALNAATHGSPRGEADRVVVDVIVEDDLLRVDIKSADPAFRLPEGQPVITPTTRRGRGLPIMYAFMDEVSLTPAENGVTVHLVKRLKSDADQTPQGA